MSSKDQPAQSDIQPEGAKNGRGFSEEPDTEAHVIKATDIQPEGGKNNHG